MQLDKIKMLILSNIQTKKMSEVINLGLGVIGTITGVLALYLHVRERPNIRVEVKKCEHNLIKHPEKKVIVAQIAFIVRNLGLRGTKLVDTHLTVSNNPSLEMKLGKLECTQKDYWIAGDDTIAVQAGFWIETEEQQPSNTMQFILKVEHTHGWKTIECTSNLNKVII